MVTIFSGRVPERRDEENPGLAAVTPHKKSQSAHMEPSPRVQ